MMGLSISPSANAAAFDGRGSAALCGPTRRRERQVVVGPREALRTQRMALRDVNWIGDGGSLDATLEGGPLDVFVKVRSTRPPQSAHVIRHDNGIAVELINSEEGVAPGQACVFYDAADGEARVLGGGFIERTSTPPKELPSSAPAIALA